MKIPKVVSLAVAALGLSAGAYATPVVYDYSSGAIDITGITVDGTSVLPTGSQPAIPIAATATATIDTTLDTLSFDISQASGSTTITLCCSFTSGSNTFSFAAAEATVSGLTAVSIGNLAITGGSGSYSFSSGSSNGVTLSGTASISGATENGSALTLGSKSWSGGKPTSGTVALSPNSQTLQLDDVPLGSYTVDGQSVAITGDILFTGAEVPIPASAWLLASALGLLLLGRQLRPARSPEACA